MIGGVRMSKEIRTNFDISSDDVLNLLFTRLVKFRFLVRKTHRERYECIVVRAYWTI